MRTRLAIVEDHRLIAETVGAALRTRDFDVLVVDVSAGGDLYDVVAAHEPDLVLLDLDLGRGQDSVSLLRKLREQGVAVLMMTGVTDPVRLARCVAAGAIGIIEKGRGFDHLISAVLATIEQGSWLSPQERDAHLRVLREHETDESSRLAPFSRLSPREAEVLHSLCDGKSVDDIASEGFVSVTTVRTQVRAILRKLGVGSQLAATALARRSGWVDGAP